MVLHSILFEKPTYVIISSFLVNCTTLPFMAAALTSARNLFFLLLIEDLFITHFLLYMFSAELLFTAWQGVAFFWSILWILL